LLNVRGIIWIEEFVEKLARKHGVTRDEVRQVLRDRKTKYRFLEKGHERGENVYAALGQTSAGRYLIVFFVRKRDGRALVVSARTMTDAERKRYETK
jgi:uncharacterized DUF497 family protein